MKWSGGGGYRASYKVGHVVGFLAVISVMDRKGEIRVNCNTTITKMGSKCVPGNKSFVQLLVM